MKVSTKYMARSAMVGALYCALCLIFKPFSFGSVQLRVSECLTALPAAMPTASAGLFIGCFVSNLFGGSPFPIIDAVLGSLTTLIASFLTRRIYKKTKNIYLALIPPVILNALVVGIYTPLLYSSASMESLFVLIPYSVLTVFIGQLFSVYVIGIPFFKALKKTGFLTFC